MAKGKYAEKRERAHTEKKEPTTWAMDEDLLEHKEGAARLVDLDFEELVADLAKMCQPYYGYAAPVYEL